MALQHVVVDGSNIATEGRNLPSLAQLDEAVQAFLAEDEIEKLTVVVDATFGHRIPEAERAEYDEAIVNGEIVCPPAGAIGRGDAFVLQIADKAGATILSNDSFQEFHGDYPWLFDEGRLIGGKPVPEVGWVFVARTPVRGPVSRKATKNVRGPRRPRRSSTKAALQQPAPKSPPVPTGKPPKVGDVGLAPDASASPGSSKAATPSKAAKSSASSDSADGPSSRARRGRRARSGVEPTNELLPFIDFAGAHPVGSDVEAEVERFSSHGAYLRTEGLLAYAPLRLMGEPAPRSPREKFDLGSTYTLTVVAFDSSRRGVDLALPEFASDAIAAAAASATADADAVSAEAMADGRVTSGASAAHTPAQSDDAEETPTMATPRKSAAKKSAAKKTTAKKATAKKTAARKTAAKKTTARKAPARTTAAKKTAAKKTTARKSTAKKTAAKKTTAKKTTAKKATAKKTTARKSTAKKAAAKKTTAKRAPAKKAASRARTSR